MLFRVATVTIITFAFASVGWLSFGDPIQQAFLELAHGRWVAFAGLAVSLSASVIGVIGLAFTACRP
jgi:hypothetical protein